jgi:hypothetical protein
MIFRLSPRVTEVGRVIVYAPKAVLTKTVSEIFAVYASAFIKKFSDENASSSDFVAYVEEALKIVRYVEDAVLADRYCPCM